MGEELHSFPKAQELEVPTLGVIQLTDIQCA